MLLSFIGISRNVNIPPLMQGLIYTLILEYYANNHAVRKDFQAAILPAFQLSRGTAEIKEKIQKIWSVVQIREFLVYRKNQ